MKLLLDTCTFIWLASQPTTLSKAATAAIENHKNERFLSDCSVWEICLKWESGKLKLPSPPRNWIDTQSKIWRIERLQITRQALYRVSELPNHHRDPFDRLLVAQSIEDSLSIVTSDPYIAKYPTSVVW